MVTKAPIKIFQNTVKYFPTFAVNIVLVNGRGEIIFVKRKNNPAKGQYYLPGGRMLNGETVFRCAGRIMKEELGIKGKIVFVSGRYIEEIWAAREFKDKSGNYPKGIKYVHYISTVAVARMGKKDKIKLDSQSENYIFSKKIPNKLATLRLSLDLANDFLKKI